MLSLKDRIFARLSGFSSYVNGKYLDIYFEEVRSDIEELREGMSLCKFERDANSTFQYLVRKYDGNYCPSTYYRFFSEASRRKYSLLREHIDSILSHKDDFFSDFLA